MTLIDVPRKVSRPKVKSIYKPDPVYNDVDDGHFVFENLGRCAFRVKAWKPGERTDVLRFDKESCTRELSQLRVGANVPSGVKNIII